MTYTTQELIQILDRELQANWKGERILLSWENRLGDPVVAMALDPKRTSKVFAYRDFRDRIHSYQIEHCVSGIVWRAVSFGGKSVEVPELHEQLIAIPGDKEVLMAAKESVLFFWQEVTAAMNLWCADHRRSSMTDLEVKNLARQAQWTEIDATRTEVYLGLCWGNPQEHQYRWAWPKSGIHRIVAANNEPSSIKL